MNTAGTQDDPPTVEHGDAGSYNAVKFASQILQVKMPSLVGDAVDRRTYGVGLQHSMPHFGPNKAVGVMLGGFVYLYGGDDAFV